MTSMLESVIKEGTGYPNADIGRPAAGKTGTTSSFRDAWFVGLHAGSRRRGVDRQRRLLAHERVLRRQHPGPHLGALHEGRAREDVKPHDFVLPVGEVHKVRLCGTGKRRSLSRRDRAGAHLRYRRRPRPSTTTARARAHRCPSRSRRSPPVAAELPRTPPSVAPMTPPPDAVGDGQTFVRLDDRQPTPAAAAEIAVTTARADVRVVARVAAGELHRDACSAASARLARLGVRGEVSNLRVQANGNVVLRPQGPRRAAELRRVQRGAPRRFRRSRTATKSSPTATCADVREGVAVPAARVRRRRRRRQRRAAPRYEALKARLDAEGLFAPERKRPLPRYPFRVALVTSPSGRRRARFSARRRARARRTSRSRLVPTPVQGERAAPEIARAIARASAMRTSISIVRRARRRLVRRPVRVQRRARRARARGVARPDRLGDRARGATSPLTDFVADHRARDAVGCGADGAAAARRPAGAGRASATARCSATSTASSPRGGQRRRRRRAATSPARRASASRRCATALVGLERAAAAGRAGDAAGAAPRALRTRERDRRRRAMRRRSLRRRRGALGRARSTVARRRRLRARCSNGAPARLRARGADARAAHDPATILQRGYAIVTDEDGRALTDAERGAARAR